MKRQLLTALSTAAFLIPAFQGMAQINHGGTPPSWTRDVVVPQDLIPTERMAAVDVESLMAEDAINDANKQGPWRFGHNMLVNYNLDNSGLWEELGKGDRVWRIGLHSKDALSINIEFSTFHVPVGGQVFMYNADRSELLGSWTSENMKEWGGLATTLVGGETAIVEYYEPAAVRGQGALTISRVTHGYRSIFGYAKKVYDRGLGDSGSCNNNVICPEGDNWRCQIKSVAIIVVNGSGACTGTVLNNTSEDETPYFLTANHCLGGSTANWVFRFNWESSNCNQNLNGPTNQTVSGATTLVNSGGSDVALLQMSSNIPAGYDVFYSGWDASGVSPTNQTAIHHPAGDIKKISFDLQPAVQATFGGAACWNVMNWEDGTTEPGSSGSGLWDQNGRLIGQLYGGSASCSSITDDYYGRLDVSWAAGLDSYLDPVGNGSTTVLDGLGTGACAGQTFTLDAQIQGIDGIMDLCNASTVTPVAILKNAGTDPLVSATINYTYNGTPGSQPWVGTLAAGQTTNITLPVMNAQSGSNTVDVSVSNPNAGTDLNPGNDAANATYNAVLQGQTVTVAITLDQYGSETTWEILDGSNNVVASGGPYADNSEGTVESVDLCLEEGQCYDFTIEDSFGDGICCGFGDGSYEVTYNGAVLASGGEFTDSETTNFCVTVGIDENNGLDGVVVFPNPTSGQLSIDLSQVQAQNTNIRVYNVVGEVVAAQQANGGTQLVQLDLSNQARGMYFVEVTANGKSAVTKVTVAK